MYNSYIKMSGYIILLSVILLTKVTAINVTNSWNQQEIKDIKKDLTMLRSLVTSLNTSLQHKDDEIREMNATIQAQQQEIELLREGNEKGIQNNAAFQLIIQDLVTNVNILKNTSQVQMDRMNDNLTSLSSQIHYMSLSFLDAQKTLAILENATEETNKILNSQEKELNNLRSETNRTVSFIMSNQKSQAHEINNLSSEVNRTIGFSVSSSSTLINYNHKVIIYDKVITNIGAAYNSKTGMFTCNSPGTCVFTWSTMSRDHSQTCDTFIYYNSNRVFESFSYEGNGGYDEVASNTILLTLIVGDRVWIETGSGYYCFGYPYTGFSGWKI